MERPEPEFVEEILRRPARASATLSIVLGLLVAGALLNAPDNREPDSVLWPAMAGCVGCLVVFLTVIIIGRRRRVGRHFSERMRNDNGRPGLSAMGCLLTFAAVFGLAYYDQIRDALVRPPTDEAATTEVASAALEPEASVKAGKSAPRSEPPPVAETPLSVSLAGPRALVEDIFAAPPPPSSQTLWARVGKSTPPTPTGSTFLRDAGLPTLQDVRRPEDLDRHRGQRFAPSARQIEIAACQGERTPEDSFCPPSEASPAGTIGPWVESSGDIIWVRIDP